MAGAAARSAAPTDHRRRAGPAMTRRVAHSGWACGAFGYLTPTGTRREELAVIRLTVAQAVVRFLANQWTERDGVEHRLIAGCFGIFGHGNVAGVGEALLQAELGGPVLRYYQARNE